MIYTNGSKDELEAEVVVQLIYRRLGEENRFKSLMRRHFIDYSPGQIKESVQPQPLVDNPKVVELRKKKASVIGELRKLKVAFADIMLRESEQ